MAVSWQIMLPPNVVIATIMKLANVGFPIYVVHRPMYWVIFIVVRFPNYDKAQVKLNLHFSRRILYAGALVP